MIPGEMINLRAVERRDAPAIHGWLNDPLVMRGWGWSAPAQSLQVTAQAIEGWMAEEAALGRPAALIAETLTGEPLGLAILRVDRPEARSLELSLLVGDPARWGTGIGRDMLCTILDACFGGWGVHRIGVRVEEGNERALALHRSLGFTPEGRLREAAFRDGEHADILLFGMLATAWFATAKARPPAS